MRKLAKPFLFFLYIGLSVAALLAAFYLHYDFILPAAKKPVLELLVPSLCLTKGLTFFLTRLYRSRFSTNGLTDLIRIFQANIVASTAFTITGLVVASPNVPRSIYIIDFLLCSFAIAAARFSVHLFAEVTASLRPRTGKRKILIYGAGSAGNTLVREIQSNRRLDMKVVGLIDDSSANAKTVISGIPVLGRGRDVPHIVEKARRKGIIVEEAVLAMPSATGRQMREALANCRAAGLKCKTIPGLGELLTGNVLSKQVRNVSVNDLLGREPIQLEEDLIRAELNNKAVLITGGAGSIGSELSRQIANFQPKCLVILDQAESALYHLELELRQRDGQLNIVPCVGDIRDEATVDEVMSRYAITAVFHAAAYKHVPMMESNVTEAIINNIIGTWIVVKAAKKHGVKSFLMISTDKAVRPANVMGASKRAAEQVVSYVGGMSGVGSYLSVRFGNVLGSNGSVVPLFQQQIAAGGPVTVTHPEMRRYFMTIPEAVQLTLQACAMGKGSEVFVLNMGEPVRIVDLARNMIRLAGYEPDEDIEIRFTGTRPGEKLHEELMLEGEEILPTYHEKIKILRSTAVDPVFVRVWLEELQRMLVLRDNAALIEHLALIVPEYQSAARVRKATPGQVAVGA